MPLIYLDDCSILKRYNKFNLWSEELSDCVKVRYCEDYLFKYVCASIQSYTLEHFNVYSLSVVYETPVFLKFMRSGFLKYVDFHFLVFFQANLFLFPSNSNKEIEAFVGEYFKRYIQKSFEIDLLRCLTKSLNKLTPASLQGYPAKQLKLIHIHVIQNKVNKGLYPETLININNTPVYGFNSPAEIIYNTSLDKRGTTYNSLCNPKDYASRDLLESSSIVMGDTSYGWGALFKNCKKNKDYNTFMLNSFYYNKHCSLLYTQLFLKSWCFYSFAGGSSKCIVTVYPPESKSICNLLDNDAHNLLGYTIEGLDNFDYEDNSINTYVFLSNNLKRGLKAESITSKRLATPLPDLEFSFNKYSTKNKAMIDHNYTTSLKCLSYANKTYTSSIETQDRAAPGIKYNPVNYDKLLLASMKGAAISYENIFKGIIITIDDIFDAQYIKHG